MSKFDIRSAATRKYRLFDRSDLSTRYMAMAGAKVAVSLPMPVLVYQRVGSEANENGFELLTPPTRVACNQLLGAVRDQRRTIALVGSSKATLLTIVKTTLETANFELSRCENVGSWGKLVSDLRVQSAPSNSASHGQFVVVVGDAQRLSPSAFQAIVQLFNNPEYGIVQAILLGLPEVPAKLNFTERDDLSAVQALVALHSNATKQRSRVEDDLFRGWQASTAEQSRAAISPKTTDIVISPHRELAEFLGQTRLPANRPMWKRLAASVVIAGLLAWAIGGLVAAHSF